MNENKHIKNFISNVVKNFPEIKIYMYYNKKMDEYFMWHLNPKYNRGNREFIDKLDIIMLEELIENQVFNFSFGFNYSKYQEEIPYDV